MELQTTIYLVVGLSFALYIGIAVWARAGSTSEFYAAGGAGHPVMNRMAPATAWMSACLLYPSDAADGRSSGDLGCRRIIKKKKHTTQHFRTHLCPHNTISQIRFESVAHSYTHTVYDKL